MKTADDFCILPLPAYPAHSAVFAWQEENIVLNAFGRCFGGFFSVFLFLLICKVSVDWVMSCLPNRAYVLVCASAKTGKTCSSAPFFFFVIFLSHWQLQRVHMQTRWCLPFMWKAALQKLRLLFPLSQSFSSLMKALVDAPGVKLCLFSTKCV